MFYRYLETGPWTVFCYLSLTVIVTSKRFSIEQNCGMDQTSALKPQGGG